MFVTLSRLLQIQCSETIPTLFQFNFIGNDIFHHRFQRPIFARVLNIGFFTEIRLHDTIIRLCIDILDFLA